MKTFNHKTTSRERVMAPQQAQSSRAKRRKEARIAAKLAENPRLVRA